MPNSRNATSIEYGACAVPFQCEGKCEDYKIGILDIHYTDDVTFLDSYILDRDLCDARFLVKSGPKDEDKGNFMWVKIKNGKMQKYDRNGLEVCIFLCCLPAPHS